MSTDQSSVATSSGTATATPGRPRRGLELQKFALLGALLLLLADVVAQRISPDSPLPVGIVTVSIGGIYFLWLLISEGRTR